MTFIVSLFSGFVGTFVGTAILLALGRALQLWRVLPERTVLVYTFFGKVAGQVDEPGLFFPLVHFGPRALLFPLFGKAYTVSTVIQQAYLRNQLVNSEEGAPMGVGIWFEMFVNDPKAYLFQNSDPIGSLKANVATAVVKQLSNLRLEVCSKTATRSRAWCARRCRRRRRSGVSISARPTFGKWRFATWA